MAKRQTSDQQLKDLVREVLQFSPEDWGDTDLRVMLARVFRLQRRVRALEQHHRAVHPACSSVMASRGECLDHEHETANVVPLQRAA
jgi:hypothetical protein